MRIMIFALCPALSACMDSPAPTALADDHPLAHESVTAAFSSSSDDIDGDALLDGDGEGCPRFYVDENFEFVASPSGDTYQGTLHIARGSRREWGPRGLELYWNDGFSGVDSLPHRIEFDSRRAFTFGVPGHTDPNGWVESDYTGGWGDKYSLDTEWRRLRINRFGKDDPLSSPYLDASGHKNGWPGYDVELPYRIRNVGGYMGSGRTNFKFHPREGFGDNFGDHPCDAVVKLNPKRLFRR